MEILIVSLIVLLSLAGLARLFIKKLKGNCGCCSGCADKDNKFCNRKK